MARLLKVEKIARETIKPSSPTPHHLRNYKLSLFDQIAPVHYAPFLYFYTNTNGYDPALISVRLKTSLSQTLTKFYPCAGKIKDSTVDCTDDGVIFIDAQANCFLSDLLHQPDYKVLREFLPIELGSKKAATGPLVHIQVTFFKCGGMSIGCCLTHKIMDGASMCSFINSWAATTHGKLPVLPPKYMMASLFPRDDSFVPFPDAAEGDYVTKRFVFGESEIATLQNKVSSSVVPKPTRVEAVTMLVWKSTIAAARSNNGSPTLSLLALPMNTRKIMVPPLPQNSIGNTVGYFSVQKSHQEVIEIQDLVCQVRKSKDEFKKYGIKTISEEKILLSIPELAIDETLDLSLHSSLCKYPLYDADFGWGKPIWMTLPYYLIRNLVMLTETKDGKGIEVVVTMSKEDMALFERDPELLSFADVNPSVLKGSLLYLPSRI